jgi:hydrogenase maturation protease
MARNVVLGLGNTLNHDEGLGVHALKVLEEPLGAQSAVELVDGGTFGLYLLPLVEECNNLLLIDAIDAGQAPGTVVELRGDEIPLYAGIKVSQHQMAFQEVLGLAHNRSRLPRHLHLIGVQPADLTLGIGISAVVTAAMPHVVERVVALVRDWNGEDGRHVSV